MRDDFKPCNEHVLGSSPSPSTELHQAPQRETLFPDIIDSVPAIAWRGNLNSLRSPILTKQLERITGYQREDWLREPDLWKHHLHPEDCERVIQAHIAGIQQNSPYEIEYRIVGSGGRIVWLRDTIAIVGNEAFGVSVEITAPRQSDLPASGRNRSTRPLLSAAISDAVLVAMPGLFFLFDEKGNLVRWNKQAEQITEYSQSDLETMNVLDFHNGESKNAVVAMMAKIMKDGYGDAEVDLRTKSGASKPFYVTGAALIDRTGKYCIEIGIDIADRRWIERERADLSARLISAHDEERSRIARELHDDVGQKIALLSVELEQLTQRRSRLREQLKSRLQHAKDSAMEIASTLHNLSHQLHPSMLTRLGLRTALLRLRHEMHERGLNVTLTYHNVPQALPADISLCLFRVAQESLSNVLKHSGAKEAQLEIVADRDWIRMRVVDAGRGLNSKSKHAAGLGLLSMKERVSVVGGEFLARQRPERGTEIKVLIPLGAHAVARIA